MKIVINRNFDGIQENELKLRMSSTYDMCNIHTPILFQLHFLFALKLSFFCDAFLF